MAAANTVFAWEGTDKSGKKTKGEITSTNANVAKAELRKQGINPTKVTKKFTDIFTTLHVKIYLIFLSSGTT